MFAGGGDEQVALRILGRNGEVGQRGGAGGGFLRGGGLGRGRGGIGRRGMIVVRTRGRGGPNLGPPSVRRDVNVGSQTLDYAFYLLGSNTTTRVMYVQNDTQYAGSTNTVPGIVSAYYEIALPVVAANGQYVCKNGGTTGLTCGFVIDRAWSGNGFYGLVKVSQSVQPYIAETGDSGGPVFIWTSSNSQVRPMGIMKTSARINGQPCRNASTTASQNNTCFFTFMPLRAIRGDQPFTVNTVSGFVSP